MPTNVDDIIKRLSPARHRAVEARAAELIAEEKKRQKRRRARKRAKAFTWPARRSAYDHILCGRADKISAQNLTLLTP